jgi:predicted acetyltransferase
MVVFREIWADDPGAHAGIWRYLLDLDLARTFRHWNAPVDERLRHLVANARAVETKVTDSLYLRVVDVEAALRARRYAADVDLVLEVEDALLPQNSGRYRLVTADGVAEVSRVSTAPDVSMGILELGTIYLAGVPLSQLHRVQRVAEHTPGAVDAADAAFGWHRAPWCPDMF